MIDPVCEVFLTQERICVPPNALPAETGAIVDFWGAVRGLEGKTEISGIDYEAHTEMAGYQLEVIAQAAAKRFSLRQITIIHRVGFVPVGDASLLVRVGSGHRGEAFRAIKIVVDELKKRVPIWKHPKPKCDDIPTGATVERESGEPAFRS